DRGLRDLPRPQAAEGHRGRLEEVRLQVSRVCTPYLKPYFIEDVSKKYGFKYGVQTLLSFGGLTSIDHPRLHETMISGPIGGILGAAYIGKLIGNDSLICSDMCGT